MSTKSPLPVDIQVGKLIPGQRLALCMSQIALVDQLGLAFQQIQKIREGHEPCVGSSRLVQIADALGVEASFFFPSNGKNRGDTELLTLVATNGAASLLRAFEAIKDANAHRAVVTVAEALRDQGVVPTTANERC